MTALVNGLIKITPNYEVDFVFIDRVVANIVGIDRQQLHSELNVLQNKSHSSRNIKSAVK